MNFDQLKQGKFNSWTARGQEVILRHADKQLHDGEITNSGTSMETSVCSLGVGNTKDFEDNIDEE